MTTRRQRGTAIIEYPQGILLVGMRRTAYLLPGGGVEAGETGLVATAREIREEIGLNVHLLVYLFTMDTIANLHMVHWARAVGTPQPCAEIDTLAYYREDVKLHISTGTRAILDRFLAYRRDHPAIFSALEAHDALLRQQYLASPRPAAG
jgi:8-oxo-dGTP diphosphatase